MAVVREKIKDHPTLYDQDPKKVYDRVRSGWRGIHKKNHLETAGEAKLPEEEETLSDKMSRFLTSSSDFVPPSNSSYLRGKRKPVSVIWSYNQEWNNLKTRRQGHSGKRRCWEGIFAQIYRRTDHKPFKV